MGLPLQSPPRVVWKAQEGSQQRFLSCPVFEVLYEGTRGPGKTDALLMDYGQFVGTSRRPMFGAAWKGYIFRNEYKHLEDIISKSHKWFPKIWPKARWVDSPSKYKWIFPDGEQLAFRVGEKESDYNDYHGFEIPFLGFEELTLWADSKFYMAMQSVCRSSYPDQRMPRWIRSTTNPRGPGHNWVKARFIDPAPRETIIWQNLAIRNPITGAVDNVRRGRVAIHGSIWENKILLEADPAYLANLQADTDQNRKKAWLLGDWDIVAGGALDDVWDAKKHVLRPFKIPRSWIVNRSFDWGSSKPFSVGWWAESDGTRVEVSPGVFRTFPRGTLFRIFEWYGSNGQPNEGCKLDSDKIGKGIKEREIDLAKRLDGQRINQGPGDSSIFDLQDGDSIANKIDRGYGTKCFVPANKAPGTRHQRLELMRTRLAAGLESNMERPGLFIFENCRDWLRTVPVLPRDERDPDDVDTKAEDHAYDDTGYRLLEIRHSSGTVKTGAR